MAAAQEAEIATQPPSEAEPPKRLKFPTALTVLGIVLLAVWLASFFIPSGVYKNDPDTGGPVPGSYHKLPDCDDVGEGTACVDKSFVSQFSLLWRAPPNGLFGVESTTTRQVSADEEGFLYGSAQIFLFVLAVGAFITMTMKTGAIETGIKRLALRFQHSPALLVAVLMTVFAIGGTTYGMWEETLGFFVLMVPLTLALGFDRMVAVAIIFLGAGTGVVASTVNPFATGVASDAANISISDGIGVRIAMLLVLVPVAIAYVLWYGNRVRRDPFGPLLPAERVAVGAASGASIDGGGASDPVGRDGDPGVSVEEVAPLNGKQKLILVIFGLSFATMIYGFIPWDDVWKNIFDADFPLPTFNSFYFTEAATLFLVAAIIIGVIAKFGEEEIVNTIVVGAGDFLGAGLVIVAARGITVVMKNTYITDTILHWLESAVSTRSNVAFALLAFLINIPIAFLVPSSSGHAALVMPILAPLSDFAGVARSVTVTAFQSASGFVNYLTPTAAVIMGGLALAKVGYNKYLRFLAPFLVIQFVIICIFVAISTVVS